MEINRHKKCEYVVACVTTEELPTIERAQEKLTKDQQAKVCSTQVHSSVSTNPYLPKTMVALIAPTNEGKSYSRKHVPIVDVIYHISALQPKEITEENSLK